MVPVERAELVTKDMDRIAELIRDLHVEHEAAFSGQLVTSGAGGIYPLVLEELTRLAAIAFLSTFPNTTMTAPYLPGPEWVAPAPPAAPSRSSKRTPTRPAPRA